MKRQTRSCFQLCATGLLSAGLLIAASGCRGPDRQSREPAATRPDVDSSSVQPTETYPVVTDDDGYLLAGDLGEWLPYLEQSAGNLGFSAAHVCPDSETGQTFLVVAPDNPSAEMLNGFFFWLLDPGAASSGDPGLVLCIDRLFGEPSRQAALADGLYSDPRVVGLLDLSLRQLVGTGDDPAILDFILDCYRQNYDRRLNGGEPDRQTRQFCHHRIEVTYEAAILNTISFRVLPGPS